MDESDIPLFLFTRAVVVAGAGAGADAGASMLICVVNPLLSSRIAFMRLVILSSCIRMTRFHELGFRVDGYCQ
jgi:hypothetical protein